MVTFEINSRKKLSFILILSLLLSFFLPLSAAGLETGDNLGDGSTVFSGSASVDEVLDKSLTEETQIVAANFAEGIQLYAASSSLSDGTYTGIGQGRNGDITVSVIITDAAIASVSVGSHRETSDYWSLIGANFFTAFAGMNSTTQVALADTVSGATLSSNGVKTAVANALVLSALPYEDDENAWSWAEFVAAVNEAEAGGTVTLLGNLTASSGLTISKNLTIDGSGYAINKSTISGAMITVSGSGVNVSFEDITLDGKGITGGNISGNIVGGTGSTMNFKKAVVQNFVVAGTVKSNRYTGGLGGAVYTTGALNIEDTYVRNNTTAMNGGAIYATGALNITNSTFEGNKAGRSGGAVYKTGTAVITNSTFYGNAVTTTSTNTGGAIWASTGATTIINCTIVGNSAMSSSLSAGVLGHASNTRIKNSIIMDNKNGGGTGSASDIRYGTDAGYNLIGTGSSFALTGTSASGITNDGWMEATAALNGDTTPTFALIPDPEGPAYEKGDDSFAAVNGIAVPNFDQRGEPRKSSPDIGAFEAPPLGGGSVTVMNLAQSKAISGHNNVFTVDSVLTLSAEDTYTATNWVITAPATLPADTVITGVGNIESANTANLQHTETRKITVFTLEDVNLTLTVTHRKGTEIKTEDIILIVTAANHADLAAEKINKIPAINNLVWADRKVVAAARTYVDYLLTFGEITDGNIVNYSKLTDAEAKLRDELDPGGATTWEDFVEAVSEADSGDTIELAAELTASSGLTISKNLTIDGNGFAINKSTISGAMITVNGSGVNVSFEDITLDGKGITGGNINGNIAGGTGSTMTFKKAVLQNFLVAGTIKSSKVTGGMGAAVYTTGTLNIEDTYFLNNITAIYGGAVYATSALNITNSTFEGNKAGRSGGAVYKTGTAVMTNSTFYGNAVTTTSTNTGGAITAGTGTTTIINCTIVGNSAMSSSLSAGVLGHASNTRIKNSIIMDNKNGGGTGNASDIRYGTDAGYNLIGTGNSFTPTGTSTSGITNDGWMETTAALNGDTTPTFALTPDPESPAYKKGDDTFTAVNGVAVPTFDQRGEPRKSSPDIGAFEAVALSKEDLQTLIGEAEALTEDDYTADSWTALALVLEAAQAVAADGNTTQTAINNAKTALSDAIDNLEEEPVVLPPDKTELNALISSVASHAMGDYTASSWETFVSALEDAQTVAADEYATQIEIDGAANTLNAAIDDLVASTGDGTGNTGDTDNTGGTGGTGGGNAVGENSINTDNEDSNQIDENENIPDVKGFNDIGTSDWFFDAVKYVVENQIMNGTSDTEFKPNENLTRAMLITMLYRYEGEPAVDGSADFTDVASGQWYSDAIAWATAKGIVTGYGDGIFGTSDNITREQLAVTLYRYAQLKKHDVSKTADLEAFSDSTEISSWAINAMKWANGEDLINGRTTTTLVPVGTATRAEAAALLMRFIEDFVK